MKHATDSYKPAINKLSAERHKNAPSDPNNNAKIFLCTGSGAYPKDFKKDRYMGQTHPPGHSSSHEVLRPTQIHLVDG